jgi:hypothetical protein
MILWRATNTITKTKVSPVATICTEPAKIKPVGLTDVKNLLAAAAAQYMLPVAETQLGLGACCNDGTKVKRDWLT